MEGGWGARPSMEGGGSPYEEARGAWRGGWHAGAPVPALRAGSGACAGSVSVSFGACVLCLKEITSGHYQVAF